MFTRKGVLCVGVAVCLFLGAGAQSAIITEAVSLTVAKDPGDDVAGLSARAVFVWDDQQPNTLRIELINNSTGAPSGFTSAAQILTTLSFQLEGAGGPAPVIVGGTVVIGPGSQSLGFGNVVPQLGPGDDVSVEWGYGNGGSAEHLTNVVSTNVSQVSPFAQANAQTNLDGPTGLDGPQGGVVAATPVLPLGGMGAIADRIVITLQLDAAPNGMDFLHNGVIAEFGSDAAFLVPAPEPGAMVLLVLGSTGMILRRGRTRGGAPPPR